MLKNFGMSVTNIYMVIPTNSHKYNLLKPLEQAYIHFALANMWKDENF